MRAKQLRQGVLLSVLILAILWLTSLIWSLAGKAKIAIREAREVQAQHQELQARKNTLQANLAALETERGRDGAIRTTFGVARPGEEVIVVVPPVVTTTTPEVSWWQKVLHWF